jgi:uncharacterized protein YkwD
MSAKTKSVRAAVLVLSLLIASCASTETLSGGGALGRSAPPRAPVLQPRSGAALFDTGLEARAFVLANRARRKAGLPDLEMRMDLVHVARLHAKDMAERGYFSHHSPEGTGPADRATLNGVCFCAYAENLARIRNARDPSLLAVEGWLRSPGHRRNLLDEGRAGYRYTGMGVAVGRDGSVLLAQVFLK